MTMCPTEDRFALNDLAVAYCTAVDSIGDIDGVCALFTPDAVYDLTGFGMDRIEGQDGIRGFFAGVFPTMAHNAHYLSNFALTGYAGDSATARAYVHAISRGVDGSDLVVRARYHFSYARSGGAWKISGIAMDILIPPA